MKVWGITYEDAERIVDHVSIDHYGGNVRIDQLREEGKRVRTVSFVLRTNDTRGKGSRRTRLRRTTSGCWHAHRDVMAAIFAQNPDARIKTMLADYRGKADFEAKFPETAHVQCWQGGPPQLDRDRECECEAPYVPHPDPYGTVARREQREWEYGYRRDPNATLDGDSVAASYANVKAALDEWDEFIAGLKVKPRIVKR